MPTPRRSTPKSYVWFPFHAPLKTEKLKPLPPRDFKTRDGSAALELAPVLGRAGYDYAGQYLNIPRQPAGNRRPPRRKRKRGEEKWLADTDLIVLTIRPPVDEEDPEDRGRHSIPRSYSWLEDAVVDKLQRCFFYSCSRDAVRLSLAVWDRVDPAFRHLQFFQHGVAGAWLKDKAERPINPRSTIGYVAYAPGDAADGLPGVLAVFGMGGSDTLRVAHLLRTREPGLLGKVLASRGPRLVLFRMTPPAGLKDSKKFPPPGLLAARCAGWEFEQVADTNKRGGP